MYENKINLVMALPGRTLTSEQQCFRKVRKPLVNKKGKPVIGKDGNQVYTTVKEYDPAKCDKSLFELEFEQKGETQKETVAVFTRKAVPASRNITMSIEAYNYFTSVEVPYDFHAPINFQPAKPFITKDKRAWLAMDKTDRLEWHLRQTCKALGGVLTSYTVLDD